MWRLLLSNLRPRLRKDQSYFLQLIVLSCGLHAVLLTGLFTIMFVDTPMMLNLRSLDELEGRAVVVVPAGSPLLAHQNRGSQGKGSGAKIAQPTMAQSVIDKDAPTTTIVSVKKPSLPKPVAKKVEKKPVVDSKKLAKTKAETNKKLAKKEKVVPPKKAPEPVKKIQAPVPQEVAKPIVQTPVQEPVVAQGPAGDGKGDGDDILYISQQEFDTLEIAQVVFGAVQQKWQRPAGISSKLSCALKVSIGKDGKPYEIIDEEPSNIVAFDVAARTAVQETIFPARVAGKTIVLVFS